MEASTNPAAGRGGGRGRGRGIASQPRQPGSAGGLRKPGEARQPVAAAVQSKPEERTEEQKGPPETAARELRSLVRDVINDAAQLGDDSAIAKAAKRLHEAAKNSADVGTIADCILSMAEQDSEKPDMCASLVCQLSELSLNPVTNSLPKAEFRTQMLRKCAKRFGERQGLRTSDAYCGFVSLLTLIFCRLKLESGRRLEPLSGPVSQCLQEMVRGQNADELDCCIYLLEEVGPAMDEFMSEKMDDVVRCCRDRLCTDDCPPWQRAYLAQILELRAGGWRMKRPILAYYARKCNELKLQ